MKTDNENNFKRKNHLIVPISLSATMNWLHFYRTTILADKRNKPKIQDYSAALKETSIELTEKKHTTSSNPYLIPNRKRRSTAKLFTATSEVSNDTLLGQHNNDVNSPIKSNDEFEIATKQCTIKNSVDPVITNYSSSRSSPMHTRPSSALSLKYQMNEKGGWGLNNFTNVSNKGTHQLIQTDLSINRNAVVMVMIPPLDNSLFRPSSNNCISSTTSFTQTVNKHIDKATTCILQHKEAKKTSSRAREKRPRKCVHKMRPAMKNTTDNNPLLNMFESMLHKWLQHRLNVSMSPILFDTSTTLPTSMPLSSPLITSNGIHYNCTYMNAAMNNSIIPTNLQKEKNTQAIQCSIEPILSYILCACQVNVQINQCNNTINQYINKKASDLDRLFIKFTKLKSQIQSTHNYNQSQFKKYIDQIYLSYAENIAALCKNVNNRLDPLEFKLKEVQTKFNEIRKTKHNKNEIKFDSAIANTLSPTLLSKDVLEKEVESLRIALQFKINELSNLRSKHNDTINKLDKMGELSERLQASQQRTEELQALLELRQQNEKVANEHLVNLRHSYDQKLRENMHLRSENDQLSFKLQQYRINNTSIQITDSV